MAPSLVRCCGSPMVAYIDQTTLHTLYYIATMLCCHRSMAQGSDQL